MVNSLTAEQLMKLAENSKILRVSAEEDDEGLWLLFWLSSSWILRVQCEYLHFVQFGIPASEVERLLELEGIAISERKCLLLELKEKTKITP